MKKNILVIVILLKMCLLAFTQQNCKIVTNAPISITGEMSIFCTKDTAHFWIECDGIKKYDLGGEWKFFFGDLYLPMTDFTSTQPEISFYLHDTTCTLGNPPNCNNMDFFYVFPNGDYISNPFRVITCPVSPSLSISRKNICVGDTVLVKTESRVAPTYWWWEFENGHPLYSSGPEPVYLTYTQPGIYQVKVIVGNWTRYDTLIDYITVTDAPSGVQDSQHFLLHYGDSVNLNNCVTGDTYHWLNTSVMCDSCSSVSFFATNSELYQCNIQNEGCIATCNYQIELIDTDNALFVPNIFTPNGDGICDVFIADGQAVEISQCTIFNRWGNVAYKENALKWDGNTNGKPANEGVYYYYVSYKDLETQKEHYAKGYVTLMR